MKARRRRSGMLLWGAVLATLAISGPANARVHVFSPVADAQVRSSAPAARLGATRSLKVDGDPVIRSYLRFAVRLPVGATISRARLKLYARRARARGGFSVMSVGDISWREASLTYRNAPSLATRLGTRAGWKSAGYKAVALRVRPLRRRHRSFVLALVTRSPNAAVFSSREGNRKPRLVVTYRVPAPSPLRPHPPPRPPPAAGPSLPVSWGPAVPASGAYLGAFVNPDGIGGQTRQEVTNLEAELGRHLGIVDHYRDWTDVRFPYAFASGADESWDVANGRIPMISQGDAGFGGRNILDAINNGSQDALIRGLAERIRRFGHPLFYRLFWEMNGAWEPYNMTHASTPGTDDGARKFVAAWQRIHDIFRQAGATNAAFVWCPNAADVPRTPVNHWTRYYPGNAYVDWVCADGYNRGTGDGESWESFQSIFSAIYDDYPQRPFLVGETGSVEQGGDKAQWIREMQALLKTSMPRIKGVVWYSRGPSAQSREDWRIDSSPSSLAAFRAMGADPYFSPKVALRPAVRSATALRHAHYAGGVHRAG